MAIDEKKLDAALSGLQKFTDNWCMNFEAIEKQDEPVFRCKECPFLDYGGTCKIKLFCLKHRFGLGCMSR